MPKSQKLACILFATQSSFDDGSFDISDYLKLAMVTMSEQGTVVGPVSVDVLTEGVIQGLRLNGEDDAGNPIPPMVAVRFSAMAIPNQEAL
jgi:hypothetical protein